jgi:hypothetical protein
MAAEVETEWVGRRVLDVLGREEEAQSVIEAVDREDDRNAQRADDLDEDAEPRHQGHHLDAGDVQRRLDRQQDDGDDENRVVVRRVPVRVEPVATETRDVMRRPRVDPGHGDE